MCKVSAIAVSKGGASVAKCLFASADSFFSGMGDFSSFSLAPVSRNTKNGFIVWLKTEKKRRNSLKQKAAKNILGYWWMKHSNTQIIADFFCFILPLMTAQTRKQFDFILGCFRWLQLFSRNSREFAIFKFLQTFNRARFALETFLTISVIYN